MRPNVAFGASNAPNATLGALDATNATLGALDATNATLGALDATNATLGALDATNATLGRMRPPPEARGNSVAALANVASSLGGRLRPIQRRYIVRMSAIRQREE
ncbi:hypothetical protein [Amycolatopsis sp. NPDC051128]|uniref:hypothetical protein n=1 Tax=Amycolatopsis sp. NPDC051128 TaxID=3155412 RepID=UPI003413D682